jgi:serine/threonine protein kinase
MREIGPLASSTARGQTYVVADLSPGSVFAGYRIESVAGRGGMGVVYRATDLALNRPVAVKLIAPSMAGDDAFRKRFKTEARVAASLDHPNVVPIFHAGEHEGALYLAMRYVEGRDLATEIKEEGRLEAPRAAEIVGQVACALGAAHSSGLVHRDVKPGNVLLTREGHAYLSDFGLTKRAFPDSDETRTGHLVGTLNYVAPEQIRGEVVGPRADIYALGCVLFHLVTGSPPFPMDSDEAKLWAHVSEPPPPVRSVTSDADPAFDPVIERAMAKEPDDRFGTAEELADAARSVSPGEGGRGHSVAPREAAAASHARSPSRVLLTHALIHPFNLVVVAGMVIAGLLLGAFPEVVPVALVVYAVAATRTYFDADVRRKVLARRRRWISNSSASSSRSSTR